MTKASHICPACGSEAPGDRFICQPCGDDLARDLGDIPALVEQLDIDLSKQHGTRLGDGVGGSETVDAQDAPYAGTLTPKPIPYDLRASEALTDLKIVLVGWTRVLVEDRNQPWPQDDPVSISRWLMCRVDLIRDHEAGDEAIREVRAAVKKARRTLDRKRELIYAGPCEVKDCTEHLYARPKAKEVVCTACGSIHDVKERREWMQAAIDGMLVTPAEAATLLTYFELRSDRTRTRNLIVVWAKRKRLLPHGVNLRGDATYRFGEVLSMVAAEEAKAS